MGDGTNGHKHATRFEFTAARNTAVFVCSRVRDGAPVLFVSRDRDGDWQFLCGGNEHGDGGADGASLACLECVVAGDLTLNDVSDLCSNWTAERPGVGGAWRRHDRGEDFIVLGILEGYPVRLREVRSPDSYREHVGYALWFNQGYDFALQQVLWPDRDGRFPGDPDADPATTALQLRLP